MIRKDTAFLTFTALFFTSLAISITLFFSSNVTIFEISAENNWFANAPKFLLDSNNYLVSVPVGIFIYSISYLVIDIIAEFFGKTKTVKTVFVAFCINIFTFLTLLLINAAIAPDAIFNQVFSSYSSTFLSFIFIFLISQTLNVNLYHFFMKRTRGKHLWLRNNASSIISIIFESFAIISILYASSSLIGNYESYSSALYLIFNLILIRSIIAVLDTPVLYVVVKILKSKMQRFDKPRHKRRGNFNKKNNYSRRPYNKSNSISTIA
jgi:uncharacterized integral membrane protein (TIGR00697 family)